MPKTGRLLLLGLALAGCVGGPAPRDHFYRLEAGEPARLAAPLFAGTLEVDRPRTDAVLRDRAILFRENEASNEVRRHSYHQWIDSPTLLLQTDLVRYLRRAGAAELVTTPEMRLEPDFGLTGRILRLEHVVGGPAVVEVEFTVADDTTRSLLLHRTYREERNPAGSDVAAAVEAIESSWRAILERFLSDAAAR
jgi:cholesterol transport system auxiliary component